MYSEDDLLPLSGLQHLAFCERQWGLIHLEDIWAENRFTVEGQHLHERVDHSETESRGDVRTARGVYLRSLRLGLSGRADVVEFDRVENAESDALWQLNTEAGAAIHADCVCLPGVAGLWRPAPVEYKRGRPKRDRMDEVQLCAQALCLEEMLNVTISLGALYYGQTRRRLDVAFDTDLRAETERLAMRMRELWDKRQTPRAEYAPKCRNCSLVELCRPKGIRENRSAKRYVSRSIASALQADEL